MALIHAGVRRVVVAATDPFPRVDGRGIEQLRQSGIQVDVGLMKERAEEQNAGFLLNVTAKRPLVTLKLATSLDGRIATGSGESQWITGVRARIAGHRLRASHDAIMVGANTARLDDPSLTCRLPGMERTFAGAGGGQPRRPSAARKPAGANGDDPSHLDDRRLRHARGSPARP